MSRGSLSVLKEEFELVVRGSGGGGAKKSGESDANTLRSKARARMVEVISEGEIEGLVDGAKSIYFGETPLQNADGTYNFKNVQWDFHTGLPDEGYFNGQSAVETPFSVEVEVKKATGPVLRTIVDDNADAVRVIVRLPALVRRDDETGTLHRTSVSYAFDVRPAGGTWTEALVHVVNNEKAVSPVQIAHRIPLPANGSPWDVRMRRITADSSDTSLQNQTVWESYVTLVEGKFIYPHTAAIGLEVDAESMGNSLLPRAYRVRGIKMPVPSNYNPVTRTYTGIWNGTFKLAWTNNPAWVFNLLATHPRFGLGEFVDQTIVDKWRLYSIAQYCDQMVPTGYKDANGNDILEPRYTYNGVLNTQDEAYFVLQQIATTWRGMGFWALGRVFATADMPEDPIKIVSPANVIGDFDYQGTSFKARHSVAVVSWNDPEDFFRPSTEVVINDTMLAQFGWRDKPVQLHGCTSRGLARRYGRWILDTEQNETETVTYKASWDHAQVQPGQIIGINDPGKAQVRAAGRIVSHVGNVITLDAPFQNTVGQTYQLTLTMPTGDLATRQVLSFNGAQVTVASGFPATAIVNAMYSISGSDIAPRLFRVLANEEIEKNVFQITALFHDPTKYARVERGLNFDPPPYIKPSKRAYPPTNLAVTEAGYTINGTTRSVLTVSWTPPVAMLALRYRVEVETPSDGRLSLGETGSTSLELRDVELGTYKFFVRSIGVGGAVSPAAEISFDALGASGWPLGTVSNLRLADRADSNEFIGRNIQIAWDNNFATKIGGPTSNAVSPLYKLNTVKIYERDSSTLLRTQRVVGERFTYTYDMNVRDAAAAGLPNACRAVCVEVSVTDIYDRTSLEAIAEFYNLPPTVVAPTIEVAGQRASISWPPATDIDHAGTIIWCETTSGYDPMSTIAVFDGTGNSYSFFGEADRDYYLRIASYDAFGRTGLVISPEIHFVNDNLAAIINEDFGDIQSILTGVGEGTLADIVDRIHERIADVANATVDNAVVSHTRRVEMIAETASVRAGYLEAVSVVVSDVEALATTVELLSAHVDNDIAAAISAEQTARADADGALANSISLLSAQMTTDIAAAVASEATARANADGALASNIQTVAASSAQGTASGLFEMRSIAGPSGVATRIAAIARKTAGGTEYEAGWFVDITTGNATRFAVKANQFALLSTTGGVLTTPFVIDAGVAYIETALIRNLTSNNIQAGSINGGSIAANTILAKHLEIGSRNITLEGIVFEHNSPGTNRASWTAGYIRWISDTGAVTTDAISAGSTGTWSSGTFYIYWVKGANAFSVTTSVTTAMGVNNVIIATYRGGVDLDPDYGRTIVDGSTIKTGTVDSNQIKANAVKATHIQVSSLEAISAVLGNVTVNGSLVVNGSLITDKIASGAITRADGVVTAGEVSGVPTLQTFAIDASDGERLIITASAHMRSLGQSAEYDTIYLRRNGSIVASANINTDDEPSSWFSLTYVDNNPGNHTWTFTKGNASLNRASQRIIQYILGKR
jgi:hypothetical protein